MPPTGGGGGTGGGTDAGWYWDALFDIMLASGDWSAWDVMEFTRFFKLQLESECYGRKKEKGEGKKKVSFGNSLRLCDH